MPIIDIGQRHYKVFNLVNSGNVTSLPSFCDDGKYNCDYKIPVFADGSSDDLKNDKSSILIMASSWVSSILFFIEKKAGSTWVEQDSITNNSYGGYYPQGSFSSKLYYAGLLMEWKEVLGAFGVGEYRIRIDQVNPILSGSTYSQNFCLKEYNCSPDNSVRLEWYNNKGIGDINNDKEILDFSDLNWYSQMRLPMSFFGYPKSTYQTEEVQYQNGEYQDISNDQEEKYQLITGALPAWAHNTIKTLACQGTKLYITDYSSNNPSEIIQKQVKLSSAYEPRWKKSSKCAPVTLEFKPANNRLELFKCL